MQAYTRAAQRLALERFERNFCFKTSNVLTLTNWKELCY